MPSQWVSVYQDVLDRFRNRPSAVAIAAGGFGLLCGALVVAMTGQPAAPQHAAIQAPLQSALTAQRSVETTGVAPRVEQPATSNVASGTTATPTSSDCDAQTWPYITRECLAKRHAERSRVRIITTDRITPPAPAAIEPERTAETQAASVSLPSVAVPSTKMQAPAVTAVEAPTDAIAAEPVPLPLPRPDVASATPANETVSNDIAERPTPAPSKRARNARMQQREQGNLRRAAQNVRSEERVAEMDRPRGRVVERWTEREYDVPSERGVQRQRVIVRSGGGYPPGPFGAIFGTVFR